MIRPRRWLVLATLAVAAGASAAGAVEVDCLIEPRRTVALASPIEGIVAEVLVDRGDVVHKGQVVARLESSVEQASVEAARGRARATGQTLSSEARLRFAERKFGRESRLKEQNVLAASSVDETASAREVAAAELKEARETQEIAGLDLRRAEAVLEQRTIRSPVDGVVVQRLLTTGEYADPAKNELLKLAEIDPLRVEVFAPLGLLGKITVGMKADVLPEKPVGGEYVATVTVVDRVVDAASGDFGVRLDLPNPGFKLPAGLKCRIRFPVQGDTGIPRPAASPAAPASDSTASQALR